MITAINGRKGRMSINAVLLNIDDCNVSFVTNDITITGFEDQQTGAGGLPNDGRATTGRTDAIDDFSGTLSGFVNAQAMPASLNLGSWSTPVGAAVVGLVQGAIVANVKLFLDKSIVARYCGCTSCIITRVNYMTKVDNAWKYSIEIKCAGGVITHPA